MKTLDLKEVRDRFELYKTAFNKKTLYKKSCQ